MEKTSGGQEIVTGYRIFSGGEYIVIPYYLPSVETVVFGKKGNRSLEPGIVMSLLKSGLRVVNAADPRAAAEALLAGRSSAGWESYAPPDAPDAGKRPGKGRSWRFYAVEADSVAARKIKEGMPEGPARDAALAYYTVRGPGGFTQAERDRAGREAQRRRRRLERMGCSTAGMDDASVELALQMKVLERSYARQPDIDGDFDAAAVADA